MKKDSTRRPLPRTPSETERLCDRYSITQPPDLSQGIASRRWLEIGRLLHSLVILPGEVKNKKPFRPVLRTAITIVAAVMNAEIGVGPSITPRSQTGSGICACLPAASAKTTSITTVS